MLKFISTLSVAVLCLGTVSHSSDKQPSENRIVKFEPTANDLFLYSQGQTALERIRGRCKFQQEAMQKRRLEVLELIKNVETQYGQKMSEMANETEKLITYVEKLGLKLEVDQKALVVGGQKAIEDYGQDALTYLAMAYKLSDIAYKDALIRVQKHMDNLSQSAGELSCGIKISIQELIEELAKGKGAPTK